MSDALPRLLVLAMGGSVAPLCPSPTPAPSRQGIPTCAWHLRAHPLRWAGSAVSTLGRVIGTTVGALLIVLGLTCSRSRARRVARMETINSMSPPRAFGFGMALFPLQVKNLAIFVACFNLIIASSLSPRGSIAALMLVLLVFAIPVLAFIGLYAAQPPTSTMLGSLQAWMGKNNRAITVALCFVFGTFFLLRGLLGA